MNAKTEHARAERYASDWRKVCNALNTSPDSDVSVLLMKIAVLQKRAAENARIQPGTYDTVIVPAKEQS